MFQQYTAELWNRDWHGKGEDSFTIYDSDFIENNLYSERIVEESLAVAIITIYERRKLPVLPALLAALSSRANVNGYSLFDWWKEEKRFDPGNVMDKYEEDFKKLLVLM